ncbi:olfactory receptor 13H1-like [Acinonyx jubatus]|uniref:Olfactory receptor 13H1-like n=1 Tax=Acinonyx jubatus TaxID=32536 RepID=A0ABM3NDY0_ACIJB|nr:olfactory receptor 13H1-like [Acinonyx jubatus]
MVSLCNFETFDTVSPDKAVICTDHLAGIPRPTPEFLLSVMALTKCLLPAVPLVTQGVSSPLLQEEIRLFWQMVVNVSGNLSFLDICYSTSWEPYVLAQCFRDFPIIFYTSCYAQMTTSLFPGMTECLFHAVMVYDRFVTISNPLHYTTIMNNEVCVQLALGTWASAFLVAVLPFIAIPACYYGQNAISHFTCEIQAPLKLICSDTPVSLILGLVISVFILTLPFTIILISYFHIVVIVLRIHSVEASLKSFFICGPYLTVVNIFNGSHLHVPETSKKSQEEDKFVSIFYGAVSPMLIPLTYTLRNKGVRGTLRKLAKGNEKS